MQMMARQPRPRTPSSSTSTSVSSEATCSSEPVSGRRTVVFALDGSARSLAPPNNDEQTLHRCIAAEFTLELHEIQDVFHMPDRPEDLVEMDLQACLLQTTHDQRHPPIMRLLLVDLEIFVEQELLPFAFRRVAKWLPHTMTRLTLLRLLGVEDLCQQHEQRCRVWHNNILISPETLTPLSLNDGDYMHVFIGDDDQMQ